jgi:hypothetical protein
MTAVDTPAGVIYVSREGLFIINGLTATRICPQFDVSQFYNKPFARAAYRDGYYLLSIFAAGATSATNGLYRFDVRNPGQVEVTREALSINAFSIFPDSSGTDLASIYPKTRPSLVVLEGGTGKVYEWDIAGQSQGGTVPRSLFTWRSSYLVGGDFHRPKAWSRMRLNHNRTAALTVTIRAGDNLNDPAGLPVVLTFTTSANETLYQLPAITTRAIQIELGSSDPSVEVFGFQVFGRILDAV